MITEKFSGCHIKNASELLLQKYLKDREKNNFFGFNTFNREIPEKSIEKIFNDKYSAGYCVFDENRNMLAYILGSFIKDEDGERIGWIHYGGYALKEGENPEIMRYLYSLLGDHWISWAVFNHYVMIPENSEIYRDIFLRLSFSYQQVHGYIDLSEYENTLKNTDGKTEIRSATLSETEDVEFLSGNTMKYQTGRPVWIYDFPEIYQELREGYSELISKKDTEVLIAYKNNKPVGITGFRKEINDINNFFIPENSVYLAVASTIESERKKGISSLLFYNMIESLKKQNYRFLTTNWRITNLLSSVHWPSKGFIPFMYRFHRNIDQRVIYTKINRE